jgi:hypothetical protein
VVQDNDVNVIGTKSKITTPSPSSSLSSEKKGVNSTTIHEEKTSTKKAIADEKSSKKTTKESDQVISNSKSLSFFCFISFVHSLNIVHSDSLTSDLSCNFMI